MSAAGRARPADLRGLPASRPSASWARAASSPAARRSGCCALTADGAEAIAGWQRPAPVGDRPGYRALARRLLDAGMLAPRPAPAAATSELTVVVPVRDRPAQLARCLDAVLAACPGAPLIVVDDGSADPAALERGLRRARRRPCSATRSRAAPRRRATPASPRARPPFVGVRRLRRRPSARGSGAAARALRRSARRRGGAARPRAARRRPDRRLRAAPLAARHGPGRRPRRARAARRRTCRARCCSSAATRSATGSTSR